MLLPGDCDHRGDAENSHVVRSVPSKTVPSIRALRNVELAIEGAPRKSALVRVAVSKTQVDIVAPAKDAPLRSVGVSVSRPKTTFLSVAWPNFVLWHTAVAKWALFRVFPLKSTPDTSQRVTLRKSISSGMPAMVASARSSALQVDPSTAYGTVALAKLVGSSGFEPSAGCAPKVVVVRSQPEKSVPSPMVAPVRSAPAMLVTPANVVPVRVVFVSTALVRSRPDRSAPLRSTPGQECGGDPCRHGGSVVTNAVPPRPCLPRTACRSDVRRRGPPGRCRRRRGSSVTPEARRCGRRVPSRAGSKPGSWLGRVVFSRIVWSSISTAVH